MWIKKNEIEELSQSIRRIIDGKDVDIRVSEEGVWNILRNDIHILAQLKNEQVRVLEQDKTALKDTLADISHQLKTPLTSMLLMADLLENAPPDKQAEFIANIKRRLHHTEWLVSALLKMAKLDAGAVQFSRETISSQALAALALEPLQIQLELKSQRVKISGGAALRCDMKWTAEALANIIKNASEHSPNGSVITVESGENPLYDYINVVNEGKGRPSFRRFESTGNGYGIGLPLALSIMRAQNGDIDFETDINVTKLSLRFFK